MGYAPKILKGNHGEVQIEALFNRLGTFEQEIVKNRQTLMTFFNASKVGHMIYPHYEKHY